MKWLHFIISHSIFISLCAAALVFQSALLLHIHLTLAFYGFIFCITLGGYNSYWLMGKYFSNTNVSLGDFLKKEWIGLLICLLTIAGSLIFYFSITMSITILLPAILLGGLYTVPLIPAGITRFARKAGVLKTIILSFTWAYTTVILPLQKHLLGLNRAEIFLFGQRFLFMLILCIIFDTRDIAVDKIRGLHSLATDISAQALKVVITVIFIILFISSFLFREITFLQSVLLQVSTMALLIVYFLSTKKQGYFFYYFLVDGMMLFSALLTFLASI